MHVELLCIWRIVVMLFLCVLMVVIGLHFLCMLVILKNQWSNIIRKFCLKELLTALHYVIFVVSASIQEVKTLNPSVHIIHYMEGTLLADPSDGILLQALALLIQQALNFRNSCCSRKRFKGNIFFNIWGFSYILNKL